MSGGAPPLAADRSGRACRIVVADAFRDRPGALALGRDLPNRLAEAARLPGGRGEHAALDPDAWGAPVRVRPGRRGGWLGPLLGARYAGPARPLREHALVVALHGEGLPVAQPVFAAAWRVGLSWRCAVATVEQPAAADLAAWLDAETTRSIRLQAARAVARALRRLHDAGVTHGDLQLRNLLLEPGDRPDRPRCTVVDFDRARRGAALPAAARLREWMRLARSLEKTGRGEVLTPRVLAAALATYCEGDRVLRRAMRRALPHERTRLRRHRLGWRLGARLRGARR
ncbi:MAG: lipopolysaccharide kinase InaA family protein [Myxococcota bacterium]